MKFNPFATLILLCVSSIVMAQPAMPQAGPEHDVLKNDVGTWDAQVTLFMGGQEMKSTATESCHMVGDFWLVSNFQGTMGGTPFTGHGMYGYDAKAKKYVGSWIDSMSPNLMHMTGTYDESSKTLKMEGVGIGPDGKASPHEMTTVYQEDGSRVFTMLGKPPGSDEMVKMMVITYAKADHDDANHDHADHDHDDEGHGHADHDHSDHGSDKKESDQKKSGSDSK